MRLASDRQVNTNNNQHLYYWMKKSCFKQYRTLNWEQSKKIANVDQMGTINTVGQKCLGWDCFKPARILFDFYNWKIKQNDPDAISVSHLGGDLRCSRQGPGPLREQLIVSSQKKSRHLQYMYVNHKLRQFSSKWRLNFLARWCLTVGSDHTIQSLPVVI